MKYLTITRVKDLFYMIPPERQMEIMEGLTAYIDKYRKSGKCREIYIAPGLKTGVTIWEIDSGEEADRLWIENPMYPFLDVETYVLADFDVHVKALKEKHEHLAKK